MKTGFDLRNRACKVLGELSREGYSLAEIHAVLYLASVELNEAISMSEEIKKRGIGDEEYEKEMGEFKNPDGGGDI